MSDTIHLACVTCRTSLWVGQGGGYSSSATPRLYGTEEARSDFAAFYGKHWEHEVRLVSSHGLQALEDASAEEWTEEGNDGDADALFTVAAPGDYEILAPTINAIPHQVLGQRELTIRLSDDWRAKLEALAADKNVRILEGEVVVWQGTAIELLSAAQADKLA